MTKKIIISLVASLFVLFCGCILFAQVFLSDLCANTVRKIYPSPLKRMSAIVFEKDCGATAAPNLQIGLLEGNKKINEGRIPEAFFVIDANHGEAPHDSQGLPLVRVEWITENKIKITHNKTIRIFRADLQEKGVAVEYQSIP